jgi:hypothetical protein
MISGSVVFMPPSLSRRARRRRGTSRTDDHRFVARRISLCISRRIDHGCRSRTPERCCRGGTCRPRDRKPESDRRRRRRGHASRTRSASAFRNGSTGSFFATRMQTSRSGTASALDGHSYCRCFDARSLSARSPFPGFASSSATRSATTFETPTLGLTHTRGERPKPRVSKARGGNMQ